MVLPTRLPAMKALAVRVLPASKNSRCFLYSSRRSGPVSGNRVSSLFRSRYASMSRRSAGVLLASSSYGFIIGLWSRPQLPR